MNSTDSHSHDLHTVLQDERTTIHQLRKIWEQRSLALWLNHPELYLALIQRLKHRNQPFLVFEIASEGRECENIAQADYLSLSHSSALSLARTGAIKSAQSLLQELLSIDPHHLDTVCLLARLQKDLADQCAADSESKTRHLQAALSYYTQACELEGQNYYPLINRATIAFLLGKQDEAMKDAVKVVELCQQEQAQDQTPDYWLSATLGEALLLQGDLSQARQYYSEAAAAIGHDFSSLQSMRSQARRILLAMSEDPAQLDAAFVMPRVVIFSGHLIDAPDRAQPRFPTSSLPHAIKEIHRTLEQWSPLIACCSAAPGADLIFCEQVIATSNQLRIVLPFDLKTFRHYILESSDQQWLDRFDLVISQAISVVTASHGDYHESLQGPAIYDFVNRIILGSALFESQSLEVPLQTLALWDGLPAPAPGGTADCIALWKSCDLALDTQINPLQVTSPTATNIASTTQPIDQSQQQIKAILFADIVGYSKLNDYELPHYYQQFLQQIAATIEACDFSPLTSNSWGDAFYFVFDSVREAGLFALEFRQAIEKINWTPQSTGKALRFRIALNAGPVFKLSDPLTGTLNYTGQHTNRAARIEPIVQEGQIYVSEYFAALAAVEQITEFSLEYVGYRPLPKNYGSSRVFILQGK
ncbi:MAG: TRAFs-binding domain-containing protein [Verrucomicrobiales bacterium]|nr:TRAFs-binding domain-containing protein [Verrucomicrobiales bacterium]